MSRLTKKSENYNNNYCLKDDTKLDYCGDNTHFCIKANDCNKNTLYIKNRTCPALKMVDKLGEYEDINESPEELAKLVKKSESIVTCGECKFKKTQRCPQSQPITSDKHPFSFSGWGTPSDDYYCASGERRE